jgi:hypothetical protein
MTRVSPGVLWVASLVLACSVPTAGGFTEPNPTRVTVTGLVTCSQCLSLAQHKGFTPWTWAMYKISQGDDIVMQTSGRVYRLQGDRQELSKYVGAKAQITGKLIDTAEVVDVQQLATLRSGLPVDTIAVVNISRPTKKKR